MAQSPGRRRRSPSRRRPDLAMPPEGSRVLFQRAGRGVRRAGLAAFARTLMHELAGGRGFVCLITDDRELQRLNREFLAKDAPTDVLSFPSGERAGDIGQLAISAERALEQAHKYGHSAEEEVRILMLHGVLHLLGMDHERDRGAMARTEREWRIRLGLPAGLTERVHS